MTYRTTLPNLLILLAAWMILLAAGCGLVYLGARDAPESTPRRTRPPLVYRP